MHFPCRNWKPTLTIRLFLLLITGCIIITLWRPESWPWTIGLAFFSHTMLAMVGLFPRSTLLGPNITRLPPDAAQRGEIAVTIDDGPDPEVTPLVLDILDRYQAKATFFCIGKLAAQHPELCREIVRRGHDIENHSHTHSRLFSLFTPGAIHRDVLASQQTLAEITGRAPRFFRPTAGLRNPELEPVLAHCGLHLCSWSRRGYDTRIGDADVVLARLTRDLKGGDILLLHDGSAARTAQDHPVILDVLPRLLDNLAQRGLRPVTLNDAIP